MYEVGVFKFAAKDTVKPTLSDHVLPDSVHVDPDVDWHSKLSITLASANHGIHDMVTFTE